MELVKKNIHMDYTKAVATEQFVLEEDVNLPDVKPDIDYICLERGNVIIDEVKAYADSATIRGRLVFHVLYHTDEEGCNLASLEGKIPFEEKVYLEGIQSSEAIEADAVVEDISISIINSRKLGLQTVINLTVKAEDIFDWEIPIGLQGQEKAEYRQRPMDMVQMAVCKKDSYGIREEITLPASYPNIFRILWSNTIMDDVEIRTLDGRIFLQGDMQLFVIYETEDGIIRNFETAFPFSGNVECYGCKEGMIPYVTYQMGQPELTIRPDHDGEERILSLEALLDLKIKIYEEMKVDLVTDIYGVHNEIETMEKETVLRKLLTKTTGKQKITEHIHPGNKMGSIMQILHSEGQVIADKQKMEENKVVLTGTISLQILYVNADDSKPYNVLRKNIPYRYELEVPGMKKEDIMEVQSFLEQLQVSILNGEELDIKAVPVFVITIFSQKKYNLVNDVILHPLDTGKLGELPGMAIYTVKAGDTLWSIGKKYYLSVERLKKINELTSDEVKIGQKLVISKEGI